MLKKIKQKSLQRRQVFTGEDRGIKKFQHDIRNYRDNMSEISQEQREKSCYVGPGV